MKKSASEKYLKMAKTLTKREVEYLLMRMGEKLGRRIDAKKILTLEALAIQLEIEEHNRSEWRNHFAKVKARYDQLQDSKSD